MCRTPVASPMELRPQYTLQSDDWQQGRRMVGASSEQPVGMTSPYTTSAASKLRFPMAAFPGGTASPGIRPSPKWRWRNGGGMFKGGAGASKKAARKSGLFGSYDDNGSLVLQRQFREGCGVMPAWRRGAWHGSVWPVRYCPAYPQATAATRLARTVPGAAFPAPPGRPAAS